MRTRSRRDGNCWTCRLRHKRCDATKPVCGGCRALNIDCHYSTLKPPWMDNGPQQRHAANRVSEEIKRAASQRRARSRVKNAVRDLDHASRATLEEESSGDGPEPGHEPLNVPNQRRRESARISASWPVTAVKEQAWELQPTQDTGDSSLHSRTELDIGSAMSFIDHIFPMLYPFYQPRIIDGSRSWLLLLLVRSRSYLSTIISLVSYFFSVVPVGPEPGRMVCNEITWENLQMQMDDSMSALQGDLKRLSRFSSGESLLLSARVLANMLQLLKLEAIIGSSNNWKLHLDAAVELFKQMLEGHDGNQFVSPLLAIQEQMVDMPDASRPPPSMGPLSNAHQVSVRFSAAMLLYNDIVSSTVLGQSPRLRRYHSDLLGGGTASPLPGMLRLEEFIGCQNWALLQVGAVAALDAWKIEMLDKGHACELDLRERARTIDAALLSGLADLDSAERLICPSAPQTKVTGDNTINGTVFRRFHSSGPELEGSRILSTRIWAWSARAYLETVVSGWQPQHPEIQNVVAETIILFRQVDMVSHMATLIWPLCVIACLATAEEELVFRQFIGSLQGLQKLGIMRDVLNIVETVWKTRESRKGANMWSVRACLSCLGHRVLLA